MALWGWALVTGYEAVFRNRKWAWPVTGLLLGLGILVKHIMVLWLPCFGLFLLVTPARRGLLLTSGFWRMSGLAFLGAVPILWWNSQHHWVMFFHEVGHADHGGFHLFGPINYLLTQTAILLVFWFVAWVMAAIRYMPGRAGSPESMRFLWFMSVPVVAFFGAFALKNGGGEPNWPMAAYLAGGVLVAAWMLERFAVGSFVTKRVLLGGWVTCALLALVGTIVLHEPIWFQPMFEAVAKEPTDTAPMPLRAVDPTCRIRGYKHLASEVDKIRAEIAAGGTEPVLAAMAWTLPGELGFYCEGHPTVYGIGPAIGDRHSQYDLWHPNPLTDPEAFRGKTFLIVVPGLLPDLDAFESMEPVRFVHYREGKNLITIWTIAVGHNFRGFPTKKAAGF
jgi:4-amino-4-deoxy-L-arabinose transferase-like glycosyltransferase